MERFKLNIQMAENEVEIQFDLKKLPGESGPSYMITVAGTFQGYITKNRAGQFVKLTNMDFKADEMITLNMQLHNFLAFNKFGK
jgi:hypothetical protein